MQRFLKLNWVIIIILLIATVLRIYDIEKNSMYGDELTIGLDSYSLLRTGGYDQTGAFLPLTFSMGAGRPAGYVYGTIPFVAIFGPTNLGVRGLSLASGILLIVVMFLLGRKLFNYQVGVTAAFLTAISPWDINISRGGFETHFALLLSVLSILALLYIKNRPWLLVASAVFFILAINTYPTYKLTLPLIILSALYFLRHEIWKLVRDKKLIVVIAVLLIFSALTISLYQTFYAGSESRFSSINIFSDSDIKKAMDEKISYERGMLSDQPKVVNIFHSRYIEYFNLYIQNYFQTLSPDFIFVNGDRNPRHNMSLSGGFYLVEIVLIGLGLGYLFRRKHPWLMFLILWIIIAPIPTALLRETHALRSLILLPPLLVLSSVGLSVIFNLNKRYRYVSLTVVGLLFAVQFLIIAEKLYISSPLQFGRFWSASGNMVAQKALEAKSRYDYVIISVRIPDIEYSYPILAQVEPKLIIEQNKNRFNLNGYDVKKFDNVYIGYIPDNQENQLIQNLAGSVIYYGITTEMPYLPGYKTVMGPDNKVQYVWAEKIAN